MRPWSRPYARLLVVTSSIFLLLALINLVINTQRVSTWLPLIVMMPALLYFSIYSLRNQSRR